MSAELLRDLARAKAAFQLRAIEAIIYGPASVDGRRMAETENTGSVRSTTSAVPKADAR